MSLVALIEWIHVTSPSSSELSKLFPFTSNLWSMTSAEFWWDAISSLIFFSSIVSLLILILYYVSVSVCKVMSVLNELLVWTLIWWSFEFTITLSLFYAFRLFDSLLLTCELTVVHLLSLEMYEIFLPFLLLEYVNTIIIYFNFVK